MAGRNNKNMSAAIEGLKYIQPKVKSDLREAERLLSIGDWPKALAHALIFDPPYIGVRADYLAVPPELRQGAANALAAAASMWHAQTGGQIAFRPLSGGAVKLIFHGRVVAGGTYVAGDSRWSSTVRSEFGQSRRILSATVDVSLQGPTGTLRTLNSIQNTIAHELGHVIGLVHTGPGGVMGSNDGSNNVTVFSAVEADAIADYVGVSATLANCARNQQRSPFP